MKKPATILALPLAALLAACGDSGADGSSMPSPAMAHAATIADPAPPAFAVCRSCHSTQPRRHGIGPSLHRMIGAKAGATPGYAFSPALKSSGIVWDRASLDTWLKGPMKMVPGTKMVLPVSDPAKRKAIIDYLETLK